MSAKNNIKNKKSSANIPQDSLAHSGIEIYKTKDKNVEKTSKDEDKEGFVLQNGEITEIAYYDQLISTSFEHDYEDISSNGSVSLIEVDETRFYKGKKILLKKAYNPKNWDDLDNCLLGFITEQTFTEDGVEIKIAGATKLLEQEKQFTYKNTKISQICKDIVESCGLKCEIDTTGLKDSKIDYSNVSTESTTVNNTATGEIADKAHEICQGLTSELEKAKAIWKYCHDNLTYVGYSGSQRGAEGCFKQKGGNCCDHAHVVVEMLKAENIEAAYEHSSSCYGGRGHVWAVAKCEGTWYRIDASVKSRGFNQVGEGCTGSRQKSIDF